MSTATRIATGLLAAFLSLGVAACGDAQEDPTLEDTGPGTTGDADAGTDQEDFDEQLDDEGDEGTSTGGTADDSFSY